MSLSARVLEMGMTAVLDVILHSRERLDVKAWELLLQRALAISPEMCRCVVGFGEGGGEKGGAEGAQMGAVGDGGTKAKEELQHAPALTHCGAFHS